MIAYKVWAFRKLASELRIIFLKVKIETILLIMVSPIAALTTSPNLSQKYLVKTKRKFRTIGLRVNLLQSLGGFLINYKPTEP